MEIDGARAVEAAVSAAIPDLKKRFSKTWPKHGHFLNRQASGFERRLYERYKTGFDLLSLHATLGMEIGDEVNQELREKEKQGPSFTFVDVLTRLHARACQIGGEIATLLRSGYADGAMARWRSLHEVSVVLHFIAENGPETAIRYADHEAVESLKAARGYNSMAARLNHQPHTPAEVAQIEADAHAVISKYEPDFDSEYGWATVALNKLKSSVPVSKKTSAASCPVCSKRKKRGPNFADIEKAVGLDRFRPYYKFASHNVHANPKGIFYRLCMPEDHSILPAGPTNIGLTDPAQNTALAITRATAVLAQVAPHSMERLCVIGVMSELADEIAEAFWQAEQAIQRDEARLRKTR